MQNIAVSIIIIDACAVFEVPGTPSVTCFGATNETITLQMTSNGVEDYYSITMQCPYERVHSTKCNTSANATATASDKKSNFTMSGLNPYVNYIFTVVAVREPRIPGDATTACPSKFHLFTGTYRQLLVRIVFC